MLTVTIQKEAKEVIVVDEDHGGHLQGHCFACGASGWLKGLGYPNHADAPGAHLHHTAECPMNAVLNDDGSLRS
jgi:hypothetical protein